MGRCFNLKVARAYAVTMPSHPTLHYGVESLDERQVLPCAMPFVAAG
jgi:hypothetical protein